MITEHYPPIIDPDDIRKLARPCDVDRDIAERAIEEATLLDIKPKLGEALYVKIAEAIPEPEPTPTPEPTPDPEPTPEPEEENEDNGDGDEPTPDPEPEPEPGPYDLLLNGGDYTDPNGGVHVFAGLRRALAYYSWGRLVKTGTNHLTRFGYVDKNDEYSHSTEAKERQIAYRDAFAVADEYIQECFVYIQYFPDLFPEYKGNGRLKSYRTRTKIIGN